jgi:hypothetical protein
MGEKRVRCFAPVRLEKEHVILRLPLQRKAGTNPISEAMKHRNYWTTLIGTGGTWVRGVSPVPQSFNLYISRSARVRACEHFYVKEN